MVAGGIERAPDTLAVNSDSSCLAFVGPTEYIVTIVDSKSLDEVLLAINFQCWVSAQCNYMIYAYLITMVDFLCATQDFLLKVSILLNQHERRLVSADLIALPKMFYIDIHMLYQALLE